MNRMYLDWNHELLAPFSFTFEEKNMLALGDHDKTIDSSLAVKLRSLLRGMIAAAKAYNEKLVSETQQIKDAFEQNSRVLTAIQSTVFQTEGRLHEIGNYCRTLHDQHESYKQTSFDQQQQLTRALELQIVKLQKEVDQQHEQLQSNARRFFELEKEKSQLARELKSFRIKEARSEADLKHTGESYDLNIRASKEEFKRDLGGIQTVLDKHSRTSPSKRKRLLEELMMEDRQCSQAETDSL